MLEVTEATYTQAYPEWQYERTVLTGGLPDYIASGNHNLRPPEYFPELPWKRAYEYIKRFPDKPPKASRQAHFARLTV